MAAKLALTYRVFSADAAQLSEQREIDGEQLTITRDVLSVQLTPEDPGVAGTLFLNVPQTKLTTNPFAVGERVTVTFAEAGE